MENVIEKIAICVEKGKISKASPFPPEMRDQDGAEEISAAALESGVHPEDLLKGCMLGMDRLGKKFSENKVFVPNLLVAAETMKVVMKHLQPHLESGAVKRKGKFVIGTVADDLHDIGKNLVGMVVRGGGYEVIDLGVDVPTEKFLEAIEPNPKCFVGISALLTTTMPNMGIVVKKIREKNPGIKILIGGAPITQAFCDEIGADFYSPDLYKAIDFLNNNVGK